MGLIRDVGQLQQRALCKSRTIINILKTEIDKKDEEYNAILTWGFGRGGGLNREPSLLDLRGIKISFFTCYFNK